MALAQDGVNRCAGTSAKAFAAIRSDPPYLVGTIPSRFSSRPLYFVRRYNCNHRGASVRRLDLGIYDIRFPGQDNRAPVVSAISDEGVSASVLPLADGIYRISLRGPLAGGEIAQRRDVPFSIVLY